MKFFRTAAIISASLMFTACAGVATMQDKNMAGVPTKTFVASKPLVMAATNETIEALGYKLKETKDAGGAAQIYFSKPMSAFSWGEVGRIDVLEVTNKTTQVSLASEKRYQLQITGTKEKTFAEQIFTGIDKRLAK